MKMVDLILINKPILDLTFLLTNPIETEISLALMELISIFLILWSLSTILNFKKQNYKYALLIAIIVSIVYFIIRSISLIFSLTDIQKPIVNKIVMISEFLLLFILIKKTYNLKWLKSILTLVITYFGKLMIVGIITMIIIFFFTTIMQDIEKERIGDNIKIGTFESTKIDDYTFNFKSNISFVTRTENIKMIDLKCMIPHALLFPNIEDHITEYKFESFDYRNLDLKVKGSAYFDCSSSCMNSNASMNTGSTKGTEILFIDGGGNIILNFNFTVNGNESEIINCTPIINSKNPEFTTEWYTKLFEINYIAD